MDYRELDKVRGTAAPLQLDTIEAFAAGRLSRRDFIKRGTILGLSTGAIGMVLAACGSSLEQPVRRCQRRRLVRSVRSRQRRRMRRCDGGCNHRRHDAHRRQKPGAVDPVAMQDLGGYGIMAQSFEFLCTLGPGRPRPSRPGLGRVKWEPNDDGDRLDVQASPGREVAGRHRPSPPTDVAATMERLVAAGNSGLKRHHRPGGASPRGPVRGHVHACSARNGNFPYLVSVFNAQTLITPEAYVDGHHPRRGPGRHRRLEARPTSTRRPAARSFGTTTGGAARRRSTAPSSFLRRIRPDGHRGYRAMPGRRPRPVRRCRRRRAARQTPTSTSIATRVGRPPSDLDARTRASSPTSGFVRPSP